MPEKKEIYPSLSGIRALCALGIVMMHVRANSTYEISGVIYNELIPFFTHFVLMFMMLSAFGLCCGYYERIASGGISPAEFYERRYKKILPFFALLVVIDVGLERTLSAAIEGFADITLLFGLLPDAEISVIGVGWFIGVVFVFYLLFPFFVSLLKTKKRAWISFGVAVMYNAVCVSYFNAGSKNILFCAMYFLAGGIIYLYRGALCDLVGKHSALSLAAALCVSVGCFLSKRLLSPGEFADNLLRLVLFSAWLIYCAGAGPRLLSNRVMNFVSSVSMEIYLCHMLVFRVTELAGLNYLLGRGAAAYIAEVITVFAGAAAFSVCAKWALRKAERLLSPKA